MPLTTYTAALLSPIFLGGADNRSPEWRASSLKGLLRFWWRAIQVEPELRTLQLREQQIFGGAESFGNRPEEQPCKSTFSIQTGVVHADVANYPLLPHKHEGSRTAFVPGATFTFQLRLRPNPHLSVEQLQALVEASFYLGALGKRARRGMGALVLTHRNNQPLPEANIATICEQLNQLRSQGGFHIDPHEPQCILGPNLHSSMPSYPHIRQITRGQTAYAPDAAEELVYQISQATNLFHRPPMGATEEERWAHARRYAQQMGNAVKGIGRFASPVYTTIVQEGGQLYPLITHLHPVYAAQRTPNGQVKKTASPSQDDILRAFTQHLLDI